jgi:hypothetical protein
LLREREFSTFRRFSIFSLAVATFPAFPISIERARDTVSGFMALSFLSFYLSPEASVSSIGNSLNRDSL